MAQERWLRSNAEHSNVLRSLPIFQTASTSGAVGTERVQFLRLPTAALMAPADMPPGALPDAFVASASESERSALRHLGVRALSRSKTLR